MVNANRAIFSVNTFVNSKLSILKIQFFFLHIFYLFWCAYFANFISYGFPNTSINNNMTRYPKQYRFTKSAPTPPSQ